MWCWDSPLWNGTPSSTDCFSSSPSASSSLSCPLNCWYWWSAQHMKCPWLTHLLSVLDMHIEGCAKWTVWKKDLLGGDQHNNMVGVSTQRSLGPQVSGKVPKEKEWRSAWSRRAVSLERSLTAKEFKLDFTGSRVSLKSWEYLCCCPPYNYTISNPILPRPPPTRNVSHICSSVPFFSLILLL